MAELIYDIVEKAIRRHTSSVAVPNGTTKQDVYMAVREVMRDNPGIFWFSHQWKFEANKSRIFLRYTLSKDRTLKAKESIDDVVTNDFFQDWKETMKTWPEVTRVAYVYRWIAGYCQYNVYSAYNQTIYSVFVYRNSVCTGISKATQYLLEQLNIESRLVFGRLHNSNTTSRHCWLMVKVDGKWYHHDPTFALPSLSELLRHSGEEEIISDGKVVYNGFLTSTEAIRCTRTIEDADKLPLCTKYVSDNNPLNIDVKVRRAPELDGSCKGCLIASGSTADIYQHKAGYVLKEFHHDAGDNLLEHERDIMSRLKGCKHLLQMNDTENENNGIIIEQATPLTDLLQCHYYQLTAQGLCLLLKDVVRGVVECQERGVIYRDIHPANIYLTTEGFYKLGDFGSCYIQKHGPCAEGGVASKWFMAPETYKQGIFNERAQVYMIAMVAYYLLNNSMPPFWDEYRERSFDIRILGETVPMPDKLSRISGAFTYAFKRFLNKALSLNAESRYSCLCELSQVLEQLCVIARCYHDNPPLIDDGSDCGLAYNNCLIRSIDPKSQMSSSYASFCRTMGGYTTAAQLVSSGSPRCTYEPNIPHEVCGAPSAMGMLLFSSIGSFFSLIALPFFRRRRVCYSSVFGPSEVKRGTNMLVQVFLHTVNNEKRVIKIASQADKNAERRGYTPLSCKMKKGDKADIEINIYDKMLIKNEKKSIVWNGELAQCTFRHFVGGGMTSNNLYCEVNVYVNGVPVGCTSFLAEIVSHEARNLYAMTDAKRFEKIFVSYSHQDYDRVKYLVQGFRAQGIDYFFDRHNLRSGDVYSERIFEYIDNADLFMLCWSANAQKSEYVEKELKRALSHVYPQVARDSETLKIHPISIEPRADFPSSIRNIYHIEEL